MRYFEDLESGQLTELGSITVSEAEIIEFGRRYDPQPIHVDPVAARDSVFGGLIASGWHTGSLFMRLLVDGLFNDLAGAGGTGMEQMRVWRPLRPGDLLTARVRISEVAASRRAEQGSVCFDGEAENQDGAPVLKLRIRGRVLRRP